MAKVNIQPIKANFTDTVDSTVLDVNMVDDNLESQCKIEWRLMDTSSINTTAQGDIIICGEEYTTWHRSMAIPKVLQSLNLTPIT